MGVDFNAFIDEHRSQQTNTGIVCELYNALRYSALRSAHESKSNGSISCEKIAEVQSRLLKRLEGNTDDYSSAYSSVYEFASNATPGISGDRWVDAISKYSSWRTAVHRTTPVDVGNVGYMKALATILADTSKEELLLFIGLTTVQVVGRFINSRVAALVYPGELSAAEKQHAAVCYHMTDVAIPGALSMSPSTYLFEGHRVRKVTEVANEVLASSMQRLRRSAWLGKNSKDIISKKVAGARPVFDGLNLEAVVTKTVVPDMSSSFLDNMMNLPSDYWTHFHRHFKLNGSRSIWSNPWLQVSSSKGPLELVIPDVYMLKLLFPDDAYESIYYASVGSLLARQISTAHDLRGRTVDSNGTESHWLTPEETAKQDILIECLVQAFEASHNGSEVITAEDKSALYVAWDSLSPLLKALRSSPGFNARNSSSLHYTPLQLFFISLCFTMCAHPGDNIARFSEASWCNFPLSLSEIFKETFQCLDGSPMHSRVPCYPDSLYPEEV
ncbi:hypothetical protein V5799_020644 [Amblyomma americanum]|uniref:Uncharacterized protein n=1 Tax=Amblyomma americanum TaxID=6943 RepID=A0AAQ4ETQ8_AMBAM